MLCDFSSTKIAEIFKCELITQLCNQPPLSNFVRLIFGKIQRLRQFYVPCWQNISVRQLFRIIYKNVKLHTRANFRSKFRNDLNSIEELRSLTAELYGNRHTLIRAVSLQSVGHSCQRRENFRKISIYCGFYDYRCKQIVKIINAFHLTIN
jgi:hypothetical protein